MHENPIINHENTMHKHFKGEEYEVIARAIHTGEKLIIYTAHKDGRDPRTCSLKK